MSYPNLKLVDVESNDSSTEAYLFNHSNLSKDIIHGNLAIPAPELFPIGDYLFL